MRISDWSSDVCSSDLIVLAPVADVDQGVVQRRAIVAGESIAVAQRVRGGEHVRRNELVQQALEFGIRESDAIQRLKLLAEVVLQGSAVANVRAQRVLEVAELFDQLLLDGDRKSTRLNSSH